MMGTVRTAVWTVDKNLEVLPDAPLYGGVQGEENATLVEFQLSEDCPLRGADYQLYIEYVDATGAWDSTDVLEADQDGRVNYVVPLAWTQNGGIGTVRLIATVAGQRVYTLAGHLKYDHRDTAKRAEKNVVQTMVKDILERLEKIVDAELSETSENPVQNKAITTRLQELNKKLESLSKDVTTLEAKGVLVVEYDGQVSHTAQQIYDHAQKGGAVTLLERFESGASRVYNVVQCDAEAAVFAALSDEFELTYIELYGGGVVKSSLNLHHPTVDDALDATSTNPVQNRAVAESVEYLENNVEQNGLLIADMNERINNLPDLGDVGQKAETAQATADEAHMRIDELENAVGEVGKLANDFNTDISENRNSINTLEESAVRFTEQDLTEEQKAQVRENIGADILPTPIENQHNYFILRVNASGTEYELFNIADDMYLKTWVLPWLLPAHPSASNNGKVMMAQDGEWVLSDPPKGEQGPKGEDGDTAGFSVTSDGAGHVVIESIPRFKDIQTALDGIIAIQEELIGTITFTIGDATYTAVKGMTWAEWCDSQYNTDGYYCDGEMVHSENGDIVGYDDDTLQLAASDVIQDGYAYLGDL